MQNAQTEYAVYTWYDDAGNPTYVGCTRNVESAYRAGAPDDVFVIDGLSSEDATKVKRRLLAKIQVARPRVRLKAL